MSTTWNAFFIITLIPVFSEIIYPFITKRVKFRLLDRMIAGMAIAAVAFVIVGVLQHFIDENKDALVYDEKSKSMICNEKDYSKWYKKTEY